MKKILFVCLGNICRSPGAEAIMKAWIKKEGKEKEFLIDSAGLYSGHAGALPDERMSGDWKGNTILIQPELVVIIPEIRQIVGCRVMR